MVMEGRKYYDPNYDYRYGFNGKEDDKDFGDKQLIQDYGFRLYNPAIARFLSVDPLAPEYPELTVYQFASNTPIMAIDLDGLEMIPMTLEPDIYLKPVPNQANVWYVGMAAEQFTGFGLASYMKFAGGISGDRDGNYAFVGIQVRPELLPSHSKKDVTGGFGHVYGISVEAASYRGLKNVYGLAGHGIEETVPFFLIGLGRAKDTDGNIVGHSIDYGFERLGKGKAITRKELMTSVYVFREEDKVQFKKAFRSVVHDMLQLWNNNLDGIHMGEDGKRYVTNTTYDIITIDNSYYQQGLQSLSIDFQIREIQTTYEVLYYLNDYLYIRSLSPINRFEINVGDPVKGITFYQRSLFIFNTSAAQEALKEN